MNLIVSGVQFSMRAATAAKRTRIWSQALLTAAPLMSAPLEAAVADAFGTFWVSVPVTRMKSDGNAQTISRDLRDFGVQALPHFNAAVVDADRAVHVDIEQRTALVQHGGGEADAEFERYQGDALLLVLASFVIAVHANLRWL